MAYIKLTHACTGELFYLVWSSIVDAPITRGLTKQGLIDWIKEKYGSEGLKSVDFERLESIGTTSMFDKSVHDTIAYNRAGDGETQLDYSGIIEKYCSK